MSPPPLMVLKNVTSVDHVVLLELDSDVYLLASLAAAARRCDSTEVPVMARETLLAVNHRRMWLLRCSPCILLVEVLLLVLVDLA